MEYRELFTVNDRFEADVIEQVFREECIPYKLSLNESLAMEPIFSRQLGFGVFCVPDCARDEALDLIEQAMNARPALDEQEKFDHDLIDVS